MDKTSTTTISSTTVKRERNRQSLQSPSAATLAKVRQFARAYVYFGQANSLGGLIVN